MRLGRHPVVVEISIQRGDHLPGDRATDRHRREYGLDVEVGSITNAHYRGLAKNTAQVLTLFALSENAPETAKTEGLSAVSVADVDCLIL